MIDPLTVLAAFGPLAVDLGKSLINRFVATDNFKPASIAEWLQMRTSELELFKAMQDTGAGQSYPWVEAIVKLQRPTVAVLVLGTWAWQQMTLPGGATADCTNFASAVGFYLFGDRTLFYAKRAGGPTK
ncbi:hypothetical protein ACQ86G_21535 [Roseateles chitinivorans]|uniref:hypothetical protein n=1 Tax=Roseateles chitinivorans TaxID=2917965 RepID=UPI003D67E469